MIGLLIVLLWPWTWINIAHYTRQLTYDKYTCTTLAILQFVIFRFARPSPKCAVLMTLASGHPCACALVSWLVDVIRQHDPGLKFDIHYHRLTNSYAIYMSARYITSVLFSLIDIFCYLFINLANIEKGITYKYHFHFRLLKGAEMLHLRKVVKMRYGGGMRDFTVAEASCFQVRIIARNFSLSYFSPLNKTVEISDCIQELQPIQ